MMKNIIRNCFKEFRSYQDICDTAYGIYNNWSVLDKSYEENLRIVRFKLDRFIRRNKRFANVLTVIIIPLYLTAITELLDKATTNPNDILSAPMICTYVIMLGCVGLLTLCLREIDFYEQLLNRMLDDDALEDFKNRITIANECDRLESSVTITDEQMSSVTNGEMTE